MNINQTVAVNVKKARETKGLTLDAAAALTGVSRSMLAQIEKGDVNPTITVLWRVANGYRISFTSLIEREEEDATFIAGDTIKPLIEDEGRFVNFPLFNYDEEKRFETYRIEMEPSAVMSAEAHMSGTEEYITVFEGAVEIRVGERPYSLNRGDSIRFKSDEPHSYKNPGKKKAELSMIIYYGK